jgi:hypothetical protein
LFDLFFQKFWLGLSSSHVRPTETAKIAVSVKEF